MIEANLVKVHPDGTSEKAANIKLLQKAATEIKRENQYSGEKIAMYANGRTRSLAGAQHEDTSGRGCSWYAGPIFVTDATVADCAIAESLISDFQAEYLLTNRREDGTNIILRCALQVRMTSVIHLKKNCKVLRDYDNHIYKLRHLVENAFLHLKKW